MTLTAPANTTRAQQLLLYALIASLPFTDFLQIGLVAFNAAPVMGAVGASPEEYSGVATLYAVVAIGTIAMHRWLLERLGWRTLVQGSAALLALGAVVCGTAQRLPQFAAGRVLMALGCAAFLTVGRLLVNHIPPSPRRFTGIRFFASGLAWGGVAGPLLAATALAHANWRAGFFVLPVVAGLIALLASLAPIARPMPSAEHHSRYQPGSLLPLIVGSFLLLYALQRASFDYFSHATDLMVMALLALPALGLFAGLLARQRQPVMAARPLLTTRYLLGLAIFCVCYVVLGANNSMLPVLMQRALGLPLEVVGRYLGLGALAGVASWIVLARLLPRQPGPTRYYVVGFAALLASAWQLSRLSEAADPLLSVLPALLCNGAFIIIVLSTTAMQTFQKLQHDETSFSHANQVKNILAQFGLAAGTALATLMMQWRSSLHYERLAESLNPTNPALRSTLDQLTQFFATSDGPANAPRLALAHVALWLNREATLKGSLDYFCAVALFATGCLAVVMLGHLWRGRVVRRMLGG